MGRTRREAADMVERAQRILARAWQPIDTRHPPAGPRWVACPYCQGGQAYRAIEDGDWVRKCLHCAMQWVIQAGRP